MLVGEKSVPVIDSYEKSICESENKVFVPSHYNGDGTLVKGYCREKGKYFHITESRHLKSIAKQGLVPQFDNGIGAKEMENGEVINAVQTPEELEYVRGFFYNESMKSPMPNFNQVILEFETPEKGTKVHKVNSDFDWYVLKEKVPPKNIKIHDMLYEQKRSKLPKFKDKFDKWKAGE